MYRVSYLLSCVCLLFVFALLSEVSGAPLDEQHAQVSSPRFQQLKSRLMARALNGKDKDKDKDKKGDKKGDKKDFPYVLPPSQIPEYTPPMSAPANAPIYPCAIKDLHPTQFAVGHQAMKRKSKKIEKAKEKGDKELNILLNQKQIPVVKGPDGTYVIDHHHFSRALYQADVKVGLCIQVADFSSAKTKAEFWKLMDTKKWVHVYDENGKGPRPYTDLPLKIKDLADDPYRSLAGEVRNAGGYNRVSQPFVEFTWANWFRPLIKKNLILEDLDKALAFALTITKTPAAKGLPGYSGK